MTDINITYETLYELLRNEKNRDELQELSLSFYNDVIIYLNKNKEMLDEAIANDSNDDEKEARIRQLKNIKNLIKEIYERREKKILNLALMKSRTGSDSMETETLLPQEKELYIQCVKTFNLFRSEVLGKMLNGSLPYNNVIEPSKSADEQNKIQTKTIPSESYNEEKSSTKKTFEKKQDLDSSSQQDERDMQSKDYEQANQQINSPEKKEEAFKSKIEIKFNESVPKFLGKELEVYGPYDINETAILPNELAQILIKKGKAQEIKKSN